MDINSAGKHRQHCPARNISGSLQGLSISDTFQTYSDFCKGVASSENTVIEGPSIGVELRQLLDAFIWHLGSTSVIPQLRATEPSVDYGLGHREITDDDLAILNEIPSKDLDSPREEDFPFKTWTSLLETQFRNAQSWREVHQTNELVVRERNMWDTADERHEMENLVQRLEEALHYANRFVTADQLGSGTTSGDASYIRTWWPFRHQSVRLLDSSYVVRGVPAGLQWYPRWVPVCDKGALTLLRNGLLVEAEFA